MSCGPGILGDWFSRIFKGRIGFYLFGPHCKWHDNVYKDPRSVWRMDYDAQGQPTLHYVRQLAPDERTLWKIECDEIFFASMLRGVTVSRKLAFWRRQLHFFVTMPVFFLLVFAGGRWAWWKCRREEKRRRSEGTWPPNWDEEHTPCLASAMARTAVAGGGRFNGKAMR